MIDPGTSGPPGSDAALTQRDHERLRLMLRQMPAVLWSTDRELRFTSSEGAALGSLGWAPGQAVGMTVHEVLSGEPTALEAHARALNGQSISYDSTMNDRLFRSRVEPLQADDGSVIGVIGIAQDITERHQAEQEVRQLNIELEQRVGQRTAELRRANAKLSAEVEERRQANQARFETERRLESILENTTAVVYLKDRDGNYLLINRQFERIFDVKREDLIGHGEGQLHPADVSRMVRANDREALQAGHPIEFEEPIFHGGQTHDYLSIKFPLFDTHGQPYAVGGISTEITARKRAEQRARQHQQESAHVARLSTMGEMTSGLAHELNQPLTAISNYVQGTLYRQQNDDLQPQKLHEVLEQIKAQSERAGQIIQRLRDFVRKTEPTNQPTDLNQVIREALGLIHHETQQAEARIELDLAEDLPPFAGEAIQIEQVILNLLRNALDAGREAEGPTRITVSSRHDAGRRRVTARVQDNGPGVSEAQAPHLFEPFFTTKTQGMGVGLNISQSIMEAHGGELCAEGNTDQGMSFHVSLPVLCDGDPSQGGLV